MEVKRAVYSMVRRSWRTPLLWGNKELQMFINFTNEIMLIRDFVTEFISMIGLKMLENIEFSQTIGDANYKKM